MTHGSFWCHIEVGGGWTFNWTDSISCGIHYMRITDSCISTHDMISCSVFQSLCSMLVVLLFSLLLFINYETLYSVKNMENTLENYSWLMHSFFFSKNFERHSLKFAFCFCNHILFCITWCSIQSIVESNGIVLNMVLCVSRGYQENHENQNLLYFR